MESGIQIGLWSGGGLSTAGSGQSLSTSSSLRSYVSFKDLKDAWEVKSTTSSSKASNNGNPPLRPHASPHNHNHNSITPNSATKSVPKAASDQFPSSPPRRSYTNNTLYGQKRSHGDSHSFDTTASSTASSSFPKSDYHNGKGCNKGGGSGHNKHKGDKVKMKRGDLAREFDKVVDQKQIDKLASKGNSNKGDKVKGNENINKNRANNINSNRGNDNIRSNTDLDSPTNHRKNKTSKLQNDLLSLMKGNPTMVHSLSANSGPCDICSGTNHPTLRCRMLTERNLNGGMQRRLKELKKELEKQSVERMIHKEPTLLSPPRTTQPPTRPSWSLLVNDEEIISAQSKAPLATTAQSPSVLPAATPQSSSQAPHLLVLASPQSSSQPQNQPPQAPLDATLDKKVLPAIPTSPNNTNQKAPAAPKELSAFLTSPTGMNWEDLVRSMKPKKEPESLLDLLNKTIVIDEEDDVSELGSVDGRGHDRRLGYGRDGRKGYVDVYEERDRKRKGFVGDLEMMGNVLQEVGVRHNEDLEMMGDSSRMDDVMGSVVTVRHGQHDDVSEEEHSSISSKSTFHKHRRTTKSLPRESLEKKVEQVLTGRLELLTGRVGCSNQVFILTGKKLDASFPEKKRSEGGQHAKNQPHRQPSEGTKRIPRITPLSPHPPPSSRSQISPRGVSPRILGSGTCSAFSILKTPSKQLHPTTPMIRSPTTPGTAVETTFSSFEHSEATLSPLSGPNLPKSSSNDTSFSPIEPCISPNQLFHSPIVTPQPRSPRASKATSRTTLHDRGVAQQRTWSPQRRPQQQQSSGMGFGRGPQDVNVAPRVLSVAERRRAERHRHQREHQQGGSSSPCDDPPIVMNISTDEITISPPPPQTEEARLLYAALDTLDKNATAAAIINNNDAAIVTKNHQGQTFSRQQRQKRRESLSDPPLLPMSTTEEGSQDDEEEKSDNAHVNANDNKNNVNNEAEVKEDDDNFYYHIRGMNPLFDDEDDDVEDAVEASVEDGAGGGGEDIENNGNISNAKNNKDKETLHFPTRFENDSALKSGIENNNDYGKERPMLPAGFDAVAAAAAAKQRVEQQSGQQVEQQAVTTADDHDGGGSKKKAATNDRLSTSTATSATTTGSTSACTNITAALCAGLWNGGNSNAGDGGNAPPPQQAVEIGGDDGAICILPQSLFINRKAPTCWQVFGHRLRKTKGEF